MKILLRQYGENEFVWKTAKYNQGSFYVDNTKQKQTNIVAIENDNRKNYVQCSCCGQIFRKGDHDKFEEHKANAIKPETCFGCNHLSVDEFALKRKKYCTNQDGTFTQTLEREVELRCTNVSMWSTYKICSNEAIEACKKRQCGSANEVEISDFFTNYPGAFNDIITADKLIDAGYDVELACDGGTYVTLISDSNYMIQAYVNILGIVDSFHIYFDDTWYATSYSKRYDTLFSHNREYVEWNARRMSKELKTEIEECIKKLYR